MNHIFSKDGLYWLLYYIMSIPPINQIIPDKLFLTVQYRCLLQKSLNLKNPKDFCEKMQWLKLYNRKKEYSMMVDKYEVKKYVSDIIGEEYIIPTIGVYNSVDDIPWNDLPNQFVLKCTHDSGGLIICKEKASLDIEAAKSKLKQSLSRNFYLRTREWPYKNVKPRIIAEEYISIPGKKDLPDYKFFCFNGEPKVLFVASDRFDEIEPLKFDYFDMNFVRLPFYNPRHPQSAKPVLKPNSFEIMKNLSSKLASGIPLIRVDFYDINGKIYFGELTFFTDGGLVPFCPKEWERKLGDWISLPNKC